MDSYGIPVDLDFTKIEAIETRQFHALMNAYIGSSVDNLNQFLSECEDQFTALSVEEMHLTALVNALEYKLNSIPALNDTVVETNLVNATAYTASQPTASDTSGGIPAPPPPPPPPPPAPSSSEAAGSGEALQQPAEIPTDMIRISEHPQYKRFYNMRKFGISDPQIFQAMQTLRAIGLDPDIIDLDDPNKLVPKPPISSDSEEDSD